MLGCGCVLRLDRTGRCRIEESAFDFTGGQAAPTERAGCTHRIATTSSQMSAFLEAGSLVNIRAEAAVMLAELGLKFGGPALPEERLHDAVDMLGLT